MDSDGRALDPRSLKLFDRSVFDNTNFEQHIAKVLGPIERNRSLRTFVYVHGALNSKSNSREDAREKVCEILKRDKNRSVHPIFINWDSSFFVAYRDHLFRIRQGRRNKYLGYPTSPFYLSADIAMAIAKAPLTWGYQAKNLFTSDADAGVFKDQAKEIHKSLYEKFDNREPDSLRVSNPEPKRRPVGVGQIALDLMRAPIQFTISPLVASGGTEAWNMYTRATYSLIRKPDEYDERYLDEVESKGNFARTPRTCEAGEYCPLSGALAVFIEDLRDTLNRKGSLSRDEQCGPPVVDNGPGQLDLIAHSTGAIILNHVLQEYPDLPAQNIVYMGAAATIENVRRSVLPFMGQSTHKETCFYNLSLDPLAESREVTFGVTPAGSLLEWLDVYFTVPDQDLARMSGKWENIVRAHHIIHNDLRSRITFKKFPLGDPTYPQKHGEFDEIEKLERGGARHFFWNHAYWSVQRD